MTRLSKVLRSTQDGVGFWCPGCDEFHGLRVGVSDRPCWSYNGNPEKPTFTPSLLITSGHYCAGQPPADQCYICKRNQEKRAKGEELYHECGICHSFITDGKIQFLEDCTHHLKGQTVDLPEWDQVYGGTEDEGIGHP